MSDGEELSRRHKRAMYIHEAGHAVMALKTKKKVNEIKCDGQDGYVDADEPPGIEQHRNQLLSYFGAQQNAAQKMPLIAQGLAAFEDEFLNRLAGLAAEDFEPSGLMGSFYRGTDDLTMLYLWLTQWMSPYNINVRQAEINKKVHDLMTKALQIIRNNKQLVYAIADALEKKSPLDMTDITPLVAAHPVI